MEKNDVLIRACSLTVAAWPVMRKQETTIEKTDDRPTNYRAAILPIPFPLYGPFGEILALDRKQYANPILVLEKSAIAVFSNREDHHCAPPRFETLVALSGAMTPRSVLFPSVESGVRTFCVRWFRVRLSVAFRCHRTTCLTIDRSRLGNDCPHFLQAVRSSSHEKYKPYHRPAETSARRTAANRNRFFRIERWEMVCRDGERDSRYHEDVPATDPHPGDHFSGNAIYPKNADRDLIAPALDCIHGKVHAVHDDCHGDCDLNAMTKTVSWPLDAPKTGAASFCGVPGFHVLPPTVPAELACRHVTYGDTDIVTWFRIRQNSRLLPTNLLHHRRLHIHNRRHRRIGSIVSADFVP